MNINEFKDDFKSYLGKSNLEVFFSEFEKYQIVNNEVDESKIIVEGEYRRLTKAKDSGGITDENYNKGINNVVSRLNSILNSLQENDIIDKSNSTIDASELKAELEKTLEFNIALLQDLHRKFNEIDRTGEPWTKENRKNRAMVAHLESQIKNYYRTSNSHFKDCAFTILSKDTKYTLTSQLGFGHYGEVWKAHKKGSNEEVAIKILHPFNWNDGTIIEQFRRSAIYQKSKIHKNIVEVIDGPLEDTEARISLIILQLINGKSLKDYCLQFEGSKPPKSYYKDIKKFLLESCEAVEFLHKSDDPIAHRDICPSNILIDEKKKIAYLTDLDNLQPLGDKIGSNRLRYLGTPPYISPELRSEKYHDPKLDVATNDLISQQADIYSLTLTLLFCLKRTSLQNYNLIQLTDLKGWSSIISSLNHNKNVIRFLKKGLSASENRFTSMGEFIKELKELDLKPIRINRKQTKRLVKYFFIFSIPFIVGLTLAYSYILNNKLDEQEAWYTASAYDEMGDFKEMVNTPDQRFIKNILQMLDSLPSTISDNTFVVESNKHDGFFIPSPDTIIYKYSAFGFDYYPKYTRWSPYYNPSILGFTPNEDTVRFKEYIAGEENDYKNGTIQYFNSLSAFLSERGEQARESLKDKGQSIESKNYYKYFLSELLEVDNTIRDKYIPTLIFVGLKNNTTNPIAQSSMFRYPAYNFPLEKLATYNPVRRPWWNSATKGDWTIVFDDKRIFGEKIEDIKCGLCKPYADAKNSMPPQRAFWCHKKTDFGEVVLLIDFIYLNRAFLNLDEPLFDFNF